MNIDALFMELNILRESVPEEVFLKKRKNDAWKRTNLMDKKVRKMKN